eukprot:scaffold46291_cov67-Phaeocystis_antarctica.AAC.9
MLEESRIDYSTLKGRPRSLGFEAGSWAMKGEVPVKSEDGYEVATSAPAPRLLHTRAHQTQRLCSHLASLSQLRLLHTRAHRRGHRAALPAAAGRRRYLRRVHAGQAHRVWWGAANVQGGLLREDGAHRGGPGRLQALRGGPRLRHAVQARGLPSLSAADGGGQGLRRPGAGQAPRRQAMPHRGGRGPDLLARRGDASCAAAASHPHAVTRDSDSLSAACSRRVCSRRRRAIPAKGREARQLAVGEQGLPG